MKKILLPLCTLWFGVCSLTARAEGLTEVYQLAQDQDAKLKVAQASWRAAQEIIPQARAQLLPSVGFSTGYNSIYQSNEGSRLGTGNYQRFNYTLSATQPLYHADLLAQRRQADHRTLTEKERLALSQLDLMARVASAYFGVLEAEDRLETSTAVKNAYARHADQAKKRFEVGLAAKTDVYETQARFDIASAQELQATNGVDNALGVLREIIGQTPKALFRLKDEIPLIPPKPDKLESWVKIALEFSPSVKIALSDSETAREEIERQRGYHFPTVDATAQYNKSDGSLSAYPQESESASIGLQANIALFRGGLVSSAVRQAQANFQKSQESLRDIQEQIERATSESYRGIVSGISQIKAYKQSVLSNTSALEATKAGFEVGTRTLVDVLDAESNLYSAKLNYALARYGYLVNTIRLRQYAGTLSVEDVQEMNTWLAKGK